MAGALLRLLPAGWGAGSGSSRRCAGRGEAGGPEQWVAEGGTSWMPLQPLTGSASRPSSPCVCHGACVWLPFGLALWQVTCILGRVWGAFPPQAARPSSVSFTVRRCVEHLQTPCARSWASRLRQNQGPALLAPASHPTRGRGPAREEGDACCPEEAQRENSNVGAGWGWGGLKRRGWGEAAEAQAPGPIAAGVWALLSRLGGRVLCCTPTCQAVPPLLPHSARRSWLLQSIRAINNNLCVLTFVWFGKNRN